jgi:hypothetical protein
MTTEEAATEARTWVLEMPAPAPMYSENTTLHWRVTRVAAREWRKASFDLASEVELPQHLEHRVRVDVLLHFGDNRDRDAYNYHKYVAKPLVDGLCRPRTVNGKNGVRHEPGYQLVDDDSPRYLDGPFILIGEKVSRKEHPLGLAVVTITGLAEPIRPPAAGQVARTDRPSRQCDCGTTYYGTADACASCRRRRAIVEQLLAGGAEAAEAARQLDRDRRAVFSHVVACMIGSNRSPSAPTIAKHLTTLRGERVSETRVRAVLDTLTSDGYLMKDGNKLKIIKPLGAAA